ncbi:MAG: type VI secretion system-associated protein TagF [Nitrospiria bacterium]
MSRYTLGCFGKLPIHSDFIRFQVIGNEIRMLDQWVQEGIYYAKARLGQKWKETFHNAETWSFLFRPAASPSFLIGVFCPSRDRSGRSYPFFLFLRVDKSVFGAPIYFAPLCFDLFLKEAQGIAQTQWNGFDLSTFLSRLKDFSVPAPIDADLIREDYLQYIEHQTSRYFWTRLFGDFKDSKKYQLYRNLIDVLLPMRGESANTLGFGLKFPLTPQPLITEERNEKCDIAFWFDLSSKFLKIEEDFFVFWQRHSGKSTPAMLAFFSFPTPKQFLSLLQPDQNHDAWFNLVSEGAFDPGTLRGDLREDRTALLEDEVLSMAGFLAATGHIKP